MFDPFRKNPEPPGPPLSDEEIEAAHFPGTVPVSPDPTEAQLESLKFTVDGWESTTPGVVFVVAGDAERPEVEKLRLAKAIASRFAEVEASAKQVARVFIRDEGSWSVEEINVAELASANECDFLVCLSFSPADGSDKYGYTSFLVCFAASSSGFHPRKYVVEFL
jgi:hypothetical protein